MKDSTVKFLIKRGYKEYKQKEEDGFKKRIFQRMIDSNLVCDTNDNLAIQVRFFDIETSDYKNQSFQVDLCAEKNELWFDLKVYSITESQLVEKLDIIEMQLKQMFLISNKTVIAI